jgi:nucleoside diphosphate kinase
MPERTLALIKPDGLRFERTIRDIIAKRSFAIVAEKYLPLTAAMIEAFCSEPIEKQRIVHSMTSSDVIAFVLEKEEGTIKDWQVLMGDMDPKKRGFNTIRHMFGNVVYGSDSPEAVDRDMDLVFSELSSTKVVT